MTAPKQPAVLDGLDDAMARATVYVGIFINAEDRWQDFAPVDGQILDGDSVQIGPVTVTREPDGVWRLDAAGQPALLLRRKTEETPDV